MIERPTHEQSVRFYGAELGARTKQTARFGDAAAAQPHLVEAEQLFALGLFQHAIAEYEKAFAEQPSPEFVFNIAQSYRNVGNHQQAVAYYRQFLELKPEASNKAAVLELIDELERTAPTPAPAPRRARAAIGLFAVGAAFLGVGLALGLSKKR